MIYQYLRRRLKLIALLAAFACIFALVLSLSDLPVEAVVYAGALCVALGALAAALDFAAYARRHQQLKDMRGRILVTLEGLPEPRDQLERDHRALLDELFAHMRGAEEAHLRGRDGMIDYYTMWAHQVKTPIAAMRLLLDAQEYECAALGAELVKVEQYVDMALSYMRLEGGANDFVFRRCSLDAVVRRAVRHHARLFILKGIKLELGALDAVVLTDEKWLCFALEQILSNAVKYTRAGTVSIRAGDGPSICIEDTGIGIRAEDLPRVFDRGYTGASGRVNQRATGIGLYLTRRVLRKLGHEIDITSVAGAGTCVRVTFAQAPISFE